VRIGVVGAGVISQRGILPHLAQEDMQDRIVLQAVCDPAPGRATAVAEHFGVRRWFDRYEDLLENGDVDAVTIASPIGLHYEHGRLALEAGKHVHFNKTMTTSADQATELIELARARDLRIVASPGEVLRPQVQRIRQLIDQGAIGTLCWAICGSASRTYHEDEPERRGDGPLVADPSWYFRRPGGGPLWDMTVYGVHVLTSVLGPARRVTALSGIRIPERQFGGQPIAVEADDATYMLVDFGDSLTAFAYGTPAGRVTDWYGSYFGTRGSIIGLTLDGEPIDYPGRALADSSPGWDGDQWVLPHVVGPHRTIDEQHVFEDIMQLVDWVREGRPSPVTAEHARHVIEIFESAYRSAETGRAVDLTTSL
jgi:predicted dehydrogenase